MKPKSLLTQALQEYQESRIADGDLLEDIVDDIGEIVKDVTNKWFDKHESWCACPQCRGIGIE